MQRELAFIYFSRRKAALGGCVRVCVCVCLCRDNGKKDSAVELPGNSRPSAGAGSSFSFPFVWRGMELRAGRKPERLCFARERKRGGGCRPGPCG